MVCKKCGASLKYEEGSTRLICPFCGSEEILPESDDVKIEKIRNQTVKDVESAKLSYAKELEEKNHRQMQQEKFKKSKGSAFMIIAGLICLIACLLSFGKGYILAGLVAFLQTALFVGGWVTGMGYIKKIKPGLYILAAVLAVALMVPFFGAESRAENRRNTAVKYVWPDHGLAVMLDKPDSEYGKIDVSDDEYFSIDIYRVKEKSFNDYVENCRDKGFDVNESVHSDHFRAENDNGDELILSYTANKKEMSIHLSKYIEPEPESEEIPESTESSEPETLESSVESVVESIPETTPESAPEPEPAAENAAPSAVGADGLRPEFKAAMDSYEEFYDQYIAIMKKMTDNAGDLSVLSDYADFMAKVDDVDEKFEAWDNEEMNDAELSYYIDVQARVTKKLLEAMG